MKNAITTLRIQNFKSIKDVTMTPRRVNIIIGEPNVGKSNILEAMSLLSSYGVAYLRPSESFIRFEEIRQVFFDNLLKNFIRIETNNQLFLFGLNASKEHLSLVRATKYAIENLKVLARERRISYSFQLPEEQKGQDAWLIGYIENEVKNPTPLGESIIPGDLDFEKVDFAGALVNRQRFRTASPISPRLDDFDARAYSFLKSSKINQDIYASYLWPPYGENLLNIIREFPALRLEIARLLAPYGLKLLVRLDERRLEVIKDLEGVIYSYPYSSTADTLQRLIFYLAAIESNDDAVLLFEEPEAHSYPVYVSQLARRIVASRNNQFFVVTHSPYLITEVLEEMLTNDELTPELALYVAYYENYQTKVRQLSEEEVMAIRADGLDVFYNMARFVPSPDNAV